MFRFALAFAVLPFAAMAQDRITLPEGATRTVVEGAAGGSYVLNAGQGQTLNLALSSGTFAVFPPETAEPSFSGDEFSAVLTETGDYTVVVDSIGPFVLDVAITNDVAPGAPVLRP